MKYVVWLAVHLACSAMAVQRSGAAEGLPDEPIAIGSGPQFVFDNYLIDNVWVVKYRTEAFARVLHAPEKFAGNPVIADDGGYCSVARDDQSGLLRMWYQTAALAAEKGEAATYAIAYAESADGIAWTLPRLGRHEFKGTTDNNVVFAGFKGRASSPFVLVDIPEEDRRGFRYLMLYNDRDGMNLIGSQDGLQWEGFDDGHIARLHSDTSNAVVYDPQRRKYVIYCRAKHIYRTFQGDIIDTGESRRMARMENPRLFGEWDVQPQNFLLPDELDNEHDFSAFYGMPTRYYGGVYWGMLWPFKFNTDIHTELAYSRDGVRFERLPWRPTLIERGPEGSWDQGMTFGSAHWVEMGDQWWVYYAGHDGPHGSRERTPGIGLAKVRKEGFIGMRGPARGGVLCTRRLLWPGGQLCVNAEATNGELKVRVSDERRKPIEGFDYADCDVFSGDSVAHEVRFGGKSLDELAGRVIRLEFFLRDAELFTFRATGSGATAAD